MTAKLIERIFIAKVKPRELVELVFVDIPLKISDIVAACLGIIFRPIFRCIGRLVQFSLLMAVAWCFVFPLFGFLELLFHRPVPWYAQAWWALMVVIWAVRRD